MNYRSIALCFSLLLSLLLNGCAKNLPPGSYDSSEVGKVKKVVPGVIISKRPIHIYSAHPDTVDTAAGLDTNSIGTGVKRKGGYEYVIKLNSGDIVSIAQDEDLKLKVKQPILVIYGTNTRIVADEGGSEN